MPTVSKTGAGPEPHAAASERESWLLLSNCQALGLANCLNLVTDQVEVEHYHPAGFKKDSAGILRRWDSYQRVLVAPQLLELLPAGYRNSEKIWQIPTVSFTAYHPDICYLNFRGAPLKGPMDDYHSTIAYAGFKLGLSATQVLRMYNEDTYARLGYFDCWDHAKQQLLDKFARAGFDLGLSFANWSRTSAFMYSNNHVKVHCLMDIAKAILSRAGKRQDYLSELPHDNLMNGPAFPVYPEIGLRLGVRGNYLFKLGGSYRFIRLEQFLQDSFSVYAAAPSAAPIPEHAAMLENAMTVLRAA
ncbi:hypothetical protein LQ772_13515 [Frateuria edaphi]|uniref:WcbI family polysaccharide biosynthesis putative acetyltransferase n=1 Tax=Frateuria edaphi TaxID=2898793 RepID=UPI001E5664BE|nr:WcbI family polysaccharide biosynthesis putative acetyltransferase [Frateuria edaphi]UGB44998.1 hypothetical protein LQ772_13515 [Frateuria edaphi]